MTRHVRLFLTGVILAACVPVAFAGGPRVIGGPNFGGDGKPLLWNPAAMPIQYTVDPGPLAVNGLTTVVSNAAGLSRVQSMLGVWQGVSTAAVSFHYAGPIAHTGAFVDDDVNTLDEYNAVRGACRTGAQNPIIFDADGSIAKALGLDNTIIGFAGPCAYDSTTGYIKGAMATMVGTWQDGVNTTSNYEVSAGVFDDAMTHEFGHFLGLDHSQINLAAYNSRQCDADDLAGMPLMFPISYCNARSSYGLPTLSPDDVAWISRLYPSSTFATSYGTISGYVLFPDGITPAQGVNVIARRVDDPNTTQDESKRIAVSSVSGYLFTGFPGQTITQNYLPCTPASKCPPNGYLGGAALPSEFGSRNPQLIGYYEIPVPPGQYTVEVESVNSAFDGGSSVGPLDPPVPMPGQPEFWDDNESPIDLPATKTPITVSPGQTIKDIDIILNGTFTRFDQYEDSGKLLWPAIGPTSAEVGA